MGTNYYLYIKQHSGRVLNKLHIGKSSSGWVFALHVMPEYDINTLDDWRYLWKSACNPACSLFVDNYHLEYHLSNITGAAMPYIVNEYSEIISVEAMEQTITERKSWCNKPLLRHRIDKYCVGHGEGTWDYICGVFS